MELNSQVNTFLRGMNLDTDLSMIPEGQYRYAENVRVVTDGFGTTGALQNIEHIKKYSEKISENEVIIGTCDTYCLNKEINKIEECGVIITVDDIGTNHVYTITDFTKDVPTINLIVSATLKLNNKLSIVSNFESEQLSKIYITDGTSNIKMINIAKQYNTSKTNPIKNEYYFDIIPEAILFPAEFNSFTSGTLYAGSVQYCFQLFTEYGTESAISPLCNNIPISKDLNKGESKKILGQLSDENSGLGCVLKLTYNNTGEFNRIRVIRILYKDNISIPDIHVINEFEIDTNAGVKTITYTDNGSQFVNKLTIDEFSALIPYDFTAKTLDKLYNRLFSANIKENTWDVQYDARAYRCDINGNVCLLSSEGNDINGKISQLLNDGVPEEHDCINPYNIIDNNTTKYIYDCNGHLGGTGKNISYRFVFSELVLSSTFSETGKPTNDLELNATAATRKSIKIVYEDGTLVKEQPINSDNAVIHNYSNAYICSNYLGYMRDEIYRFGIVFYNRKGIPSPVHWIGDIRMPSTKEAIDTNSVLYPFHTGGNSYSYEKIVEQLAYAMGVEFTVTNVPREAIAWEIVRCDRTEADRTVVSQGIISSLLSFGKMEGEANNDEYSFGENDIRPMPLFNLSKTFYVKYFNTSGKDTVNVQYPRAEHYYEFVSPEICVSKDSTLSSIQNSKLNCLYQVSTYNHYVSTSDSNGHAIRALGYKQNELEVVGTSGNPENDGWFGGAVLNDARGQMRFHGGSGPGHLEGDARYWYEKQCLFKYYNVKHDKDETNYQIEDAIIGAILPYQNSLSDSKNHAQSIGNKLYTNTSVAGYQQYGNHGTNCVLQLDSNFNKTTGSNGNLTQVFNYLNTSYICNIKRNVIPYGGNNYYGRQNSIYISCGENHTSDTEKCICYGGDTYLNIFDYLNTTFCQQTNDPQEWHSMRMNTVCYIPLESIVNTNLFSSESYHNSVVGTMGNNLIQHEPVVLSNGYTQQKPLYEYNTAYSVQSETLKYIPKYTYSIDNLLSGNRIACSELKTNNEVIDSWTKFKFANYLDVDSQYGPITNLKVFRNKLYYFQDSAVGVAAVNEKSLITDNNIAELTLGTGGILTRFDYITVLNGSSIVNDSSITNSDSVIYWYDFDKNELCALSNGVVSLSKLKNVQSHLNKLSKELKKNSVGFYDKKYNEVWFRINDTSLIYNEQVQAFTSFYTHNPNWYISLSNKLITIENDNSIYLHNSHDDEIQYKKERVSNIQFVINKDSLNTKVFDNVMFSADLIGVNDTGSPMIYDVIFKTKTQETSALTINDIELREDNYRFAIPREKVTNKQESQQKNQSYLGRMRGKYLICDYTFDCNNNREFKLPYVKTTYRYSML